MTCVPLFSAGSKAHGGQNAPAMMEDLRGRGGRIPKYDWRLIFDKMDELYSSPPRPKSHVACARQIIRWLERQGIEPPDEDYLRREVSKYLRQHILDSRAFARPRRWNQAVRRPLVPLAIVTAISLAAALGWYLTPQAVTAGETWQNFARLATSAHRSYSSEAPLHMDAAAPGDTLSRPESPGLSTAALMSAPPFITVAGSNYHLIGGRLIQQAGGLAVLFTYLTQDGERMSLYVTTFQSGASETDQGYVQTEGQHVSYWVRAPFAYAMLCHHGAAMDKEEHLRHTQEVVAQLGSFENRSDQVH